MSKLYDAYRHHKVNAKRRGIPFLLSYAEWLALWYASGKLKQRGRGKDKYVMARLADTGPYAVGNVKIITLSENSRQQRFCEEHLRALREANRGENNPRTNLTNQAVRQIKVLIKEDVSTSDLAARYGVPRQVVYRIAAGHTWRHI